MLCPLYYRLNAWVESNASPRKLWLDSTYACLANDCDFSSPRLVTLVLTIKVAPLKITKILLILNKKFKLFRIIFRIIIHYAFQPRNVSTNVLYFENWPGEFSKGPSTFNPIQHLFWKWPIFDAQDMMRNYKRQKFWMTSKIERTRVGNFLWWQIIPIHVTTMNMMKLVLKSKHPCFCKWKCKSGPHFQILQILLTDIKYR